MLKEKIKKRMCHLRDWRCGTSGGDQYIASQGRDHFEDWEAPTAVYTLNPILATTSSEEHRDGPAKMRCRACGVVLWLQWQADTFFYPLMVVS